MFEMREKQRGRGARNQRFECASIMIDLRLPSVGEQGHVNRSDHTRARQDRFPVLHGEGAVERLHEYSDQSKPYCLQMTRTTVATDPEWISRESSGKSPSNGKREGRLLQTSSFVMAIHALDTSDSEQSVCRSALLPMASRISSGSARPL